MMFIINIILIVNACLYSFQYHIDFNLMWKSFITHGKQPFNFMKILFMFCEPIWGKSLLILHFYFTALFSMSIVHKVYLSVSPWISTWSNRCGCIIEYLLHLVLLFLKKCLCSIWLDILLIAWLIMATCKLCYKIILSHAKTVACAVCHWKYHLNCISINDNELTKCYLHIITGTVCFVCILLYHLYT